MGNFVQQRFSADSTRSLSELLILGILARLGKASIPDLHQALLKAKQNSHALFFVGQPLRTVLDSYRDLNQIRLLKSKSEPTYEITPAGRNNIQQFETVLANYFPGLQQIHSRRRQQGQAS